MYGEMNDSGERWITLKDGRHIKIDTNKYMNSQIRGLDYKKLQEERASRRFQELKDMYPNAEVHELYGGYEEIAIDDQELVDEFAYNWETDARPKTRGYANDTSQKMLNEMPCSLNLRWRSDYDYQNHQSHYIYKNKSDMMKAIKNFGGLDDITDHGRLNYSITSESGIGEYYLVRDKYTKGGWKWEDCNGDVVSGRERADIGRKLENDIIKHDREYIEQNGVDKFKEVFGETSYEIYQELLEKREK